MKKFKVQSFIAPLHGICLEYEYTQLYYTVWNENNKLEITLESLKTESSKFSMTVQMCSSDVEVHVKKMASQTGSHSFE